MHSTCRLLILTLLSGSSIAPATVAGAQNQSASKLEANSSIRTSVSPSEAHRYSVTLSRGTYFRIILDRTTAGLSCKLLDPQRTTVTESVSAQVISWPEALSFVAQIDGEYVLEVRSQPQAAGGNTPSKTQYELRVDQLRQRKNGIDEQVAADEAVRQGWSIVARALPQREQRRAKFVEAQKLYESVGDRSGAAMALSWLGETYRGAVGDPTKAIEIFNQALVLWRQVGNRSGEAMSLMRLGQLFSSRRPEDSKRTLLEATSLWRGLGSLRHLASTFSLLAELARASGEPEQALRYFDEALSARREDGNPSGEALTLEDTARFHMTRGNYQEGFDRFEQALELWRRAGDKGGEAFNRNSVGAFYLDLKEHRLADEFFRQALELNREIGYRPGQVGQLQNIAWVYFVLDEREKCLNTYDEALRIAKIHGDPGIESQILMVRARAYSAFGNHKEAIAGYEQSFTVPGVVLDRHARMLRLIALALAFHRSGQQTKASESIERAMALWPPRDDNLTRISMLNGLAEAYWEMGRREEALNLALNALETARLLRGSFYEGSALLRIARLRAELGDVSTAQTDVEAALKVFERARATLDSTELRASYFSTLQGAFQFYVDVLMRQHRERPNVGFDRQAFEASERARARSLLDRLTEASQGTRSTADPRLLERERELLDSIAKARLEARPTNQTSRVPAEVERNVTILSEELVRVQAKIASTARRRDALTGQRTRTVEEIQQQLSVDDILLEYALGGERSFLWVVTRNSVSAHVLAGREGIIKDAKTLYGLVRDMQRLSDESRLEYRARLGKLEKAYEKVAASLSEVLIGPVGLGKSRKRLLIVPDTALFSLPFSALPRDGQPLMVNHEIVVLPSASVLGALRADTRLRGGASKQVAVFADPVFSRTDPRVTRAELTSNVARDQGKTGNTLVRGWGDFSRLPFSREEAESIVSLTSGRDSIKALDFAATRGRVMSGDLREYRVLHFATHGMVSAENPALSGLVLSLVDEAGNAQNGFLQTHDVYSLDLQAELVVLSGCQTALGREVRGEGLIGLTNAFFYAGARRVISSLWVVNDRATAEMMKVFYREMLSNRRSPADALRLAQLEMRKKAEWRAPYFWAAFVMMGEPE